MKKTFILISFLAIMGFVCKAQDNSSTLPDSSASKATKIVQKDSIISANVKSDTANYALLYVYRPKNFVGIAISYDLKISNSEVQKFVVGRVKNNSKFVVKLYKEGKTEILAKTEAENSVSIDVKYGQKYYLKCGISMGVLVGRPDLNLVYSEQGELDYANVKK